MTKLVQWNICQLILCIPLETQIDWFRLVMIYAKVQTY